MAGFKRLALRLSRGLGIALLGAVATVIIGYALWARSQPPLQLWHEVRLDEEFTAAKATEVTTLEDYQALEARVLEELNEKVYAHVPSGRGARLNRFSPGSAADPRDRQPNWNRTFELVPDDPVGGILLLHGMSDSPYSLRAIGEALFEQGYRVLGLRMPGHGAAPSGLLTVTWEDMAAATRLGARHLAVNLDGKPLHIIGYSTGAALALDYSLDAMADPNLRAPASLVLVSPAIGITPLAKLTRLFKAMGRLPGLEQLAWTSLVPEFDPFNYNAFTANASLQVHRMTRATAARIRRLAAEAPIEGFPSTLVLLSIVDATVSPRAAADNLLRHLAPGPHELLLYDINHYALKSPLIASDTDRLTQPLLDAKDLPYAVTLIGNESEESRQVVARHKPAFSSTMDSGEPLSGAWPEDTVSLSHVDLPFPPDDPIYGRYPPKTPGQVFLGQLAIRGERGVLKVPAQWLLRLRHNPFYDYQERRVLDWIEQANASNSTAQN
jgi:alpha-beta hydrolase superfamily lysophospholipase